MVTYNPTIPFYLMEKSKEFRPGISPSRLKEKPSKADFKKEIAGLKEAIEATKNRVAEFNSGGANVLDLEFHLRNLEQRLEVAQKKEKLADQ